MARAVGTMGVVAAFVGVVTFANLTSNNVVLANNNLSSATASLAIAGGTNCNSEGGNGDTTSVQGFNSVKLVPGVVSSAVHFCLDNNGDIPMNITAQATNPTGGALDPSLVTLTLTCAGQSDAHSVMGWYNTPRTLAASPLGNGHAWNCTATAKLSSSYTGSGGQAMHAFDIQFTGTQTT